VKKNSVATAIVTTVTITRLKCSVPHVTGKIKVPLWTRSGTVKTGIRLAKNATVYVKRRIRQLLYCKVKVNNWNDVYLKA
jgi:hypothetical protein